MLSFGKRLKYLLSYYDLTQKDLSVMIENFGENKVSKFCRDTQQPTIYEVLLISQALDEPFNTLLPLNSEFEDQFLELNYLLKKETKNKVDVNLLIHYLRNYKNTKLKKLETNEVLNITGLDIIKKEITVETNEIFSFKSYGKVWLLCYAK